METATPGSFVLNANWYKYTYHTGLLEIYGRGLLDTEPEHDHAVTLRLRRLQVKTLSFCHTCYPQ